MDNIFDLYTDYLQVSLGLATATGLSKLMDNAVSHDQVTRALTKIEFNVKAKIHFGKASKINY